MPSGPSHGSHSGGGGHSGGSFGGGSRGVHIGGFSATPHPRVPRPPRMLHFFGRPILITSGFSTAVILVTFAVIITAFLFISGISGTIKMNKTIKIYENDALWYEKAIENAENGNGKAYKTTATFDDEVYYHYKNTRETGIYEDFEYNGYVYFFIVFEYDNEETGEKGCIGQTYTQFTSTQALNKVVSGEGQIEIVYAYSEEDGSWFAINADYSLDKNIEYKSTLDSKNSGLVSATVSGIIFVVLIIAIIFMIRHAIKKGKAQAESERLKAEQEIAEAKAKAEGTQAEVNKKFRYCKYCGSKINENENKCSNCGSTQFIIKK